MKILSFMEWGLVMCAISLIYADRIIEAVLCYCTAMIILAMDIIYEDWKKLRKGDSK